MWIVLVVCGFFCYSKKLKVVFVCIVLVCVVMFC